MEKKPIHVLDVQAEEDISEVARQTGERTRLAVPLLREGAAIGTITIWRDVGLNVYGSGRLSWSKPLPTKP